MDLTSLSRKIQHNFTKLTSQIDLKHFISHLYEQELICFYDFDYLLSKICIERNQQFLLNLDMYGEKVRRAFLLWLEDTYNDIFQLLCKTKLKRMPINLEGAEQFQIAKTDQDLIRKQYVLLLKRINANAIAPQLFQDGYLDRDDMESIWILKTRKQRANELLIQLTGRLKSSQIRMGVFLSFTQALRIYQSDLCDEFLAKTYAAFDLGEKQFSLDD